MRKKLKISIKKDVFVDSNQNYSKNFATRNLQDLATHANECESIKTLHYIFALYFSNNPKKLVIFAQVF
jgi:hypothetical protein